MNTPVMTRVASFPRTSSTLASAARTVILMAALGLVQASSAYAQSLGTFRWQLQPYCNVLSLAITQQGSQFTADGTDDYCGAPHLASVRGMAFLNPDGTIGFGLTIVTAPGAAPVHVDATILMTTLSGSWVDSAGNNGTFIFTPGAGASGAPRPVPSGGLAPGSVTMIQLAPGSVGTAQVADGSLTSADIEDAPGADYAGGDQDVALSSANTVVRSVVMGIRSGGTVIVNVSGYFLMDSLLYDSVICAITTGTGVVAAHRIRADDHGNELGRPWIPFAGTRAFPVTKGTAETFRLVCTEDAGAVRVLDSNMTAIFVAH